MMKDKDLKIILTEYAGNPGHLKKDTFIRSVTKDAGKEHVSTFKMIAVQAGYIRVYVWLISIAVACLPLFGADMFRFAILDVVADLMPFVAGVGIIEAMRARMYDMTELESVTLLSGKGVFYARMILIGVVQFALIPVSAVLMAFADTGSVIDHCVKLVLPYCITAIICLIVERTRFGRENVLVCLAVAGAVFAIRQSLVSFARYDPGSLTLTIAAEVLIIVQIFEFYKTVRTVGTGEVEWN